MTIGTETGVCSGGAGGLVGLSPPPVEPQVTYVGVDRDRIELTILVSESSSVVWGKKAPNHTLKLGSEVF